MKASIVIATLNEAPTLEEVLKGCRAHSDDILVADGHSTDQTREIAQRLGARVILDHGKGKGDALRTVIAHIRNDITVFIDADGSHDPADIPRLIEPIRKGEADHVSGSRLTGGSSELHGTFNECFRLMGSSLITALINWRFNVRLSESQNGLRAIRTEVLRRLNLRENGTTIEQEMIIQTLKRGFRMGEVPCHEHVRKNGKSHIRLRKVWPRYLYSLLKNLI